MITGAIGHASEVHESIYQLLILKFDKCLAYNHIIEPIDTGLQH